MSPSEHNLEVVKLMATGLTLDQARDQIKRRRQKIHLRHMRGYDTKHGASAVRLLEMTVDGALRETGYSVQFWRDVELYGIAEAVLYLKNNPKYLLPGRLEEVERTAKLILESIQDDKPIPGSAEEWDD